MSSWGVIYNNAMWGISNHTNNFSRLQEQISTGAKIIRFSDNPANANRISRLVDVSKSLEEYADNINWDFPYTIIHLSSATPLSLFSNRISN